MRCWYRSLMASIGIVFAVCCYESKSCDGCGRIVWLYSVVRSHGRVYRSRCGRVNDRFWLFSFKIELVKISMDSWKRICVLLMSVVKFWGNSSKYSASLFVYFMSIVYNTTINCARLCLELNGRSIIRFSDVKIMIFIF